MSSNNNTTTFSSNKEDGTNSRTTYLRRQFSSRSTKPDGEMTKEMKLLQEKVQALEAEKSLLQTGNEVLESKLKSACDTNKALEKTRDELVAQTQSLEDEVEALNAQIPRFMAQGEVLDSGVSGATLAAIKHGDIVPDNVFDKESDDVLQTLPSDHANAFYDVVIGIDNMTDLVSEGWPIFAKPGATDSVYLNGENLANLVGVIGDFNVGKTTILSKVGSLDLPRGQVCSTNGISMVEAEPSILRGIVLIDTQGVGIPRPEREVMSCQAAEALMRMTVVEHSNSFIVVVSKYNKRWQRQVKQLADSPNLTGGIVVVHNLINTTNIEELRFYISLLRDSVGKEDIQMDRFTTLGTDGNIETSVQFFREKRQKVSHLFMVNDHCPLGQVHNPKVITHIRALIQTAKPRRFNLLQDVEKTLKRCLTSFIPRFDEDKMALEWSPTPSTSPPPAAAAGDDDGGGDGRSSACSVIATIRYLEGDQVKDTLINSMQNYTFPPEFSPPQIAKEVGEFKTQYDVVRFEHEVDGEASLCAIVISVDAPGVSPNDIAVKRTGLYIEIRLSRDVVYTYDQEFGTDGGSASSPSPSSRVAVNTMPVVTPTSDEAAGIVAKTSQPGRTAGCYVINIVLPHDQNLSNTYKGSLKDGVFKLRIAVDNPVVQEGNGW